MGVCRAPFLNWRLIALCLLSLVLLLINRGAHAHASLLSSAPANGANLTAAPDHVLLTFNEPVTPLVLRLIQPDGLITPLEPSKAVSDSVQVVLPPVVQPGSYGLSWRVISADGHPVGGTLAFAVGGEALSPTEAPSVPHPFRDTLIWLTRWAMYCGVFLSVGWALWPAWMNRPQGKQNGVKGLLFLAVTASLLNLGLLGVDALNVPLLAIFSRAPWQAALSTSVAYSTAFVLAALVCSSAVARASSQTIRHLLAGLALLLVGASLASSGHASQAPPTWLARPAVWWHGVAVTFWIGSLLPLVRSLKHPASNPELAFLSRWLPWAVAALFLSGCVLIFLQLDTAASLWHTRYGQILLFKLALVLALLSLAAYNRYGLTRAALAGDSQAKAGVRRLALVELILAVLILAAVALWRFTPPPRALIGPAASMVSSDAQHGVQRSTEIRSTDAVARLHWTHGAGNRAASLTFELFHANLTPLEAQAVEVVFANPEAGIETLTFDADKIADATWQVSPLNLPNLSVWQVRLNILITDFDRIVLSTTTVMESSLHPIQPGET